MKRETIAVHAGRPSEGPLSPPVVLASNFRTIGYTREEGSPTWEALESAIGTLEGGETITFSSGMAAAAAVLDRLPPARESSGRPSRTPGCAACSISAAAGGHIELETVDMTDTGAVRAPSTARSCSGSRRP